MLRRPLAALVIGFFCLFFSRASWSNDYSAEELEELLASQAEDVRKVTACFEANKVPRKSPRNRIGRSPGFAARGQFVDLVNIVDDVDVEHLSVLSQCVKHHIPSNFKGRLFDENGYGGGNNVTFVGGYVQSIMSEFFQHLLDVAGEATEEAGWIPHPQQLGIRCVEMLEYAAGGQLKMHTDLDSIYTMVLMLGSPNKTFYGGAFVIEPHRVGREAIAVVKANPVQFGGILFDSNANHGVEPISTGERLVLAVEFWPYQDTTVFEKRPSPSCCDLRIPTLQRRTSFSSASHFFSTTKDRPSPLTDAAQVAIQKLVDLGSNLSAFALQFLAGLCFGLSISLLIFLCSTSSSSPNLSRVPSFRIFASSTTSSNDKKEN